MRAESTGRARSACRTCWQPWGGRWRRGGLRTGRLWEWLAQLRLTLADVNHPLARRRHLDPDADRVLRNQLRHPLRPFDRDDVPLAGGGEQLVEADCLEIVGAHAIGVQVKEPAPAGAGVFVKENKSR